jgi:hypothetical protein
VIITSMTRLGTPGCPNAAYVGTGARSMFGAGADVRWFKQRVHTLAPRVADLIPLTGTPVGTRLSAPPERSP